MNWRDEILSGLPSPRGDEPASLRRDIEDELADHLHCAMQRERTATDDEQAARRAVLARFGNPRRIAYKLWFDAMKEKIMKDRLIALALIVLLLASIAAVGLSWLSFQQSRQTNAALASALQNLTTQLKETAIPPNRCVFRLKAVEEKPGGKPAAGARFVLDFIPEETPSKENQGGSTLYELRPQNRWTLETGPDGIAQASVRPGRYKLFSDNYDKQGRANGAYYFEASIKLYGGEQTAQEVVCPPGQYPLRRVPVGITPNRPPAFEKLAVLNNPTSRTQYVIDLVFTREPLNYDRTWQSDILGLELDMNGGIPLDNTANNRLDPLTGQLFFEMRKIAPNGSFRVFTLNQFDPPTKPQTLDHINLVPGRYTLRGIGIIRKVPGSRGFGGSAWPYEWRHNYEAPNAPVLEVHDGAANQWMLALPEDLAQNFANAFKKETTCVLARGGRYSPTQCLFHDLALESWDERANYAVLGRGRWYVNLMFQAERLSWPILELNKPAVIGPYEITLEEFIRKNGAETGEVRLKLRDLATPD